MLVILLAAFLVVAGGSAAARGRMGRDSGVFLYTAWRMLEGDVLYVDVWDHKPPLIHFLNLLALLLSPDSLLGLWLIEALVVVGAALLSYKALRQVTSPLSAGVATLAWLAGLVFVLDGGNLTEEYALPLQFGCVALLAGQVDRRAWGWRIVLLGVTGGLAFLLKPNLIALWLAALLLRAVQAWANKDSASLARDLGLFLLGAAMPVGLVAFYLLVHGAWAAFWDAVIHYNAVTYLPAGLRRHAVSLYRGFRLLLPSGVLLAAAVGWLGLGVATFRRGARWLTAVPVRGLALLGLPLEFLLTNVDGLPHYYMTWLPAIALLLAFLVQGVRGAAGRWQRGWARQGHWLIPLLLLAAMSVGPGGRLAEQVQGLPSPAALGRMAPPSEAMRMLDQGLSQGEPLLIWGAEARIHFLLRRPSPTRFVYQYPLYNGRYQRPDLVEGFLEELQRHPPLVVLDTSTTNAEVPPLDPVDRAGWSPGPYSYGMAGLAMLDSVFDHMARNYRLHGTLDPPGWRVYVYQAGD